MRYKVIVLLGILACLAGCTKNSHITNSGGGGDDGWVLLTEVSTEEDFLLTGDETTFAGGIFSPELGFFRIETTEELMYYGYTEAKLEFYFHSDPIPEGSDVYLGIARIFPDGFAERVDSLYTTDNTSRTVTLDLTRLCDQETLFKLELSAIYSEFGATLDAVISQICVYAK